MIDRIIHTVEKGWQVDDALEPSDGIYVLAGGNGSREALAAGLYLQGMAGTVLLCQATKQVQGHAIDVTRLVRGHLRRSGVPAEAIVVLPGRVRSTLDEAGQVAGYVRQQGWRSLILVTDPYHTRRSLMTFNRALRGTPIALKATPCSSELLSRTDWSPEVRLYFLMVEFLKVLYYALRGRLAWRQPGS